MARTKKELFSIAQAANACSISRSTLLRMEEDGLLAPALHEEGKYRYYSTENILQAMQINVFHRMGLTRREIRPVFENPQEIGETIARLQTMRDNLDSAITELKKRTLQDPSAVIELMDIPQTLCYTQAYDVEGGRYGLGQYLQETMVVAIRKGCRFNWDRRPFMRVNRPDLAEGVFRPGIYRYHICVPVLNQPKGCREIQAVQPRRILSITWHGRVTDLPDRTLTLAAEARARGLVPTGWFHVIELLFNTPAGEHDPVSDVLQLGCIVE